MKGAQSKNKSTQRWKGKVEGRMKSEWVGGSPTHTHSLSVIKDSLFFYSFDDPFKFLIISDDRNIFDRKYLQIKNEQLLLDQKVIFLF